MGAPTYFGSGGLPAFHNQDGQENKNWTGLSEVLCWYHGLYLLQMEDTQEGHQESLLVSQGHHQGQEQVRVWSCHLLDITHCDCHTRIQYRLSYRRTHSYLVTIAIIG